MKPQRAEYEGGEIKPWKGVKLSRVDLYNIGIALDLVRAAFRVPEIKPCRPGKCPACNGQPDGEWFEGGEVKCPDCGVMLVAAVVVPCFGSTTFALADTEAT